MTAPEERFAAELREALEGRPEDERKVLLVGVLNRYVRTRALLVGGALVEFYTAGAYRTGDVDVLTDREEVKPLLLGAGFRREGRVFVNEEIGLVVDPLSKPPRPTETVVVLKVRGYDIPAVSPEDAIVDRLLAAKFWSSRTDWEQAVLLIEAQRRRLDKRQLRRKAKANQVEDALDDLLRRLRPGRRSSRGRGRGKPPRNL